MIQIKKTLSIFMAAVFVMAGLLGNITANAAALASPKINFVGLDHTPLVAGDKEALTVTAANYVGNVQYAAFIKVANVWTKLSGYGVPVDSKTPYVIPKTKALVAGKYPISIYVRKANVLGANKTVFADFESTYSLSLNCIAKNANSIYTAGNASYTVEGLKVNFNGIENIGGKVGPYLYQLFSMNTATGTWSTVSSAYSATPSYTFEEAGNYIVVAHVKTANSTKAYEAVKVINVTVKAPTNTVGVTSVSLNKTTASLAVGGTDTLVATVNPTTATNKAVTYKSSDATIATVDATGKVTAVKAGTATITATTVDGSKTAIYVLTVKDVSTVTVFDTTIKAASFGAVANVTLTADGVKAFPTATQYQLFNGTSKLSAVDKLATATVIFPAKVAGDLVTVKILDANATVLGTIDVKLGQSGTMTVVPPVVVVPAVVNATVKAASFGAIVTATSTFAGATQYQVYANATSKLSAPANIGEATIIFPGRVVGDTVVIKLLNAAGTVVATNDVVLK